MILSGVNEIPMESMMMPQVPTNLSQLLAIANIYVSSTEAWIGAIISCIWRVGLTFDQKQAIYYLFCSIFSLRIF